MDLALTLAEDEHGHDVALDVARRLVMYMKRPRGQSQFFIKLQAQSLVNQKDRDFAQWIIDHLTKDLSVARLAEHMYLSERSFARYFKHNPAPPYQGHT
jgi:transcriptional regulator GlxA family with amidase domain